MFQRISRSFPRSAGADGGHNQRPEDAVQSELGLDRHSRLSTLDWIGVQWLGEARWYFTKGLHAAFWGAAAAWSVLFLAPSMPVTAALSACSGLCIWLAIEAGIEVQEVFERERHLADDAIRLWQNEEIAHRRTKLRLENARPLWSGDGEEEQAAHSAAIIYLNGNRGRLN